MYFVQGGAFSSNSNANFNGSDLAREGNMVVVSLNYRVGSYGFLWGEEVQKGVGKGNSGIRDVIMGLEWVRDQIALVSTPLVLNRV
jgi:carboxylesterase type B